MTKSKELLLDLLIWSEKREIDLEEWIMSIRLEKNMAKRKEEAPNSRPATLLSSIEQLGKSIIPTNDVPLSVCQVG